MTKLFIDLPKYEHYLPNAFDESMSLLQKMNKIILHLDQLGHLTVDMIQKWNEVYEWVMGAGLEKEVSAKLELWLEDGTLDSIINETLFNELNGKIDLLSKRSIFRTAQEFGAKGDGLTDDTTAIQTLLNTQGFCYISEGDYRLTKTLKLMKNTYLKMHPNARLIRHHDDTHLSTGDTTSRGYDGQGNILIEGGIIDCNGISYPDVGSGLSIIHGNNITVRDTTILNTSRGHAMEISGSKNVLVENVKFKGYAIDPDGSNYYVEAIQIEPTLPPPIGAGYTFEHVTDSTPSKDVVIQHCYFGPSEQLPAFPCAIGQHGAKYGLFYENIKILNNTIEGCSYWAIRPFKFSNCLIEGNTVKNGSGGGIYVVTPGSGASIEDVNGNIREGEGFKNVTISNNLFSRLGSKAIYVIGADTGYLSHINVHDNVAENITGYAYHMEKVDNGLIAYNSVQGVSRGVYVASCRNIQIVGNRVMNSSDNGIMVTTSSSIDIIDNYVEKVQYYAINITGSNTRIFIDRNLLKNSGSSDDLSRAYIIISAGADDIRITNNTLRKDSGYPAAKNGLYVYSGVTRLTRFGNDFRCGSTEGNLADYSTEPVTNAEDITT